MVGPDCQAAYLMAQFWQQPPVLQQLHDDCVSEPKTAHGLVLAAESAEQAVVTAPPADCPERALPVKAFKHNACTEQICAFKEGKPSLEKWGHQSDSL